MEELSVILGTHDWKQVQREGQMGKTSVYHYIMILVSKGRLGWRVALCFEDS